MYVIAIVMTNRPDAAVSTVAMCQTRPFGTNSSVPAVNIVEPTK